MAEVATTFWLLLIAHALTDYPLQGRFIAEHKNPGSPALAGECIWPWVLSAHALINAGGVLVVTGSLTLSALEAALHWLIDYGKGRRAYGFHLDQALHVASKLLLAFAAARQLG
jgi:Protein of unknown function (DUF3307)